MLKVLTITLIMKISIVTRSLEVIKLNAYFEVESNRFNADSSNSNEIVNKDKKKIEKHGILWIHQSK